MQLTNKKILKRSVVLFGKIMVFICLIELWGYYEDHVNDGEIGKMRAEIPAVMSMDGTETLSEKMEMRSRTKDLYSGVCYIDERASEEEIVRHYKEEFEKYGWKYIGRYYLQDRYPKKGNERYYFFDNGNIYCIYMCLMMDEFVYGGGITVVFKIALKKDYDYRQYCKIEDE